jgi:hypothetical protein
VHAQRHCFVGMQMGSLPTALVPVLQRCCHDKAALGRDNSMRCLDNQFPDMTVPGRSTTLATRITASLAGRCCWQTWVVQPGFSCGSADCHVLSCTAGLTALSQSITVLPPSFRMRD